jgi:hypothetical protein
VSHLSQGLGLTAHAVGISDLAQVGRGGSGDSAATAAAAAAAAAATGAKSAAAAAAAAGGSWGKAWQPQQQKPGALIQLLLAVAALVLGLLLVYPSMMLQQATMVVGSI